jgi:hypothetical protein
MLSVVMLIVVMLIVVVPHKGSLNIGKCHLNPGRVFLTDIVIKPAIVKPLQVGPIL